MSSLIIQNQDIEPYLPRTFSDRAKEQVWKLAGEVENRIGKNILLSFRYNNEARIVQPASLYLQNETPISGSKITHPTKGYPFKLKVYTKGARRAVGMDAYELMKERKAPQWWKSFHLDKIDDLRLLTQDEVDGILAKRMSRDKIAYSLDEAQNPREDFVKNWNFWFRTFLREADSRYDLRK